MKPFATIVLLVVSVMITSLSYAKHAVRLRYLPTSSTAEAALAQKLQASHELNTLVGFLNQRFDLVVPINILMGNQDGEDPDPLYDAYHQQVLMPYEFFHTSRQLFESAPERIMPTRAATAAMHAFLHTLLHEFAHALIDQYSLPIVGREEDAADGLATLLLLQAFNDGQTMAIHAAELFLLESLARGPIEQADLWGEHSLDEQRYYQILCWVYGSQPEAYGQPLGDTQWSIERLDMCVEDYNLLHSSWSILLSILDDYSPTGQR